MKELTESELERAVMDAMSQVDESEAASASVSRETSVDYYRRVASECNDRAATIESEMAEDSAYENPSSDGDSEDEAEC